MDLELSSDLSIDALTQQFTAELAHRTQAAIGRAHGEVARLEEELRQEREARAQAEARVAERDGRILELEAALERQQEARLQAEQELAGVHRAIADQLEIAEQEQALLDREEQRRRAEVEELRRQLAEEALRRDLLQRRVETLRRAAADLFELDLQTQSAFGGATTTNGVEPAPVSFN